MHKATLDVDEEGTTAAAVTTIEIKLAMLPVILRFDRPFMIFIIDQKNDHILFLGKVVNPAVV